MARIAGIDLPREKKVAFALPSIYGLGVSSARYICEIAGVNPEAKVKDLTDHEVARLRDVIERDYQVEGDLKREVQQNIRRLIEISCYRGVRHRKGLPVRGQNTRHNARTRKGPRKTVAGKKKATKQ